MKILVVCQHYWPEPYYLSDVCEELVRRGHRVHVVTGVPNYPMGYIYKDYKHGKNREQVRNGVRITRTFTIGRRNSAVFRFLNYYSYSISSTLYTLRLPGDYDVVFTNQTSPVMMTRAATAYSRKWNKKCVLYCMDLWPASLSAGGIKQGSFIYRLFGHISKKLYHRADNILITSRMFREYLTKEHNIPDEIIEYLPQYAGTQFENLPEPKRKEGFDFVFAGNIGSAQSLDTVIKAAKILKNENIRWHFVGDGSELENLKKQAEGMENIIFHGRKPPEEMPEYYAMADGMLVTLTADPFISLTLPGKVQTYMAAGKPVFAAADGEIPIVLDRAKCGRCVKAEDAEAFAEMLLGAIHSDVFREFGENAREYYNNNFSRNKFMDKLEMILLRADSRQKERQRKADNEK